MAKCKVCRLREAQSEICPLCLKILKLLAKLNGQPKMIGGKHA